MSDMMASSEQARQREYAERYRRTHPGSGSGPRPTAWTIGVQFAGVMMVVLGTIHAVEGLAAIFRDEFYIVTSDGLLIALDYTTWGWIHLAIGVMTAAAGVAIQVGRTWARIVGLLFVGASLVSNLAFVNARPVWSAIVIAIDVLIIWAITVHGGQLAD